VAGARVLLVGRGTHDLAARLRRAVPRVEVLLADDADDGERYLGEVDAVVAGVRVTPAYARAGRVRWLHFTSAGIEKQAIPELRQAPLTITHKALASVDLMGDHVMAQILVFSRRVLEVHALQRQRRWASHDDATEEAGVLRGKTLGVVGLGKVGLAVARRARPFGMKIVGTKRDATGRLPNVARVYPPAALPEVLGQADFVLLSAPLTDETRGLIGEAELRAMRPGAYLVNVARGGVVREDALVRALCERWIAGASLDVFEQEPLPPEHPFWELAVVTPHYAGGGPIHRYGAAEEVATNLRRFVRGQPLRHQINRADLPRA
jgi:phosphoglycerate dehydrogenase-like enzyme